MLIASTTLISLIRPSFAFADDGVYALPPIEPAPKVREVYDGSCVAGVRVYVPNLPHMDAVWFATLPHSMPAPGNVVVMSYPDDVWHIAYILSVSEDGFTVYEWNYHHGKKDTRLVPWDDPAIYSFFDPNP